MRVGEFLNVACYMFLVITITQIKTSKITVIFSNLKNNILNFFYYFLTFHTTSFSQKKIQICMYKFSRFNRQYLNRITFSHKIAVSNNKYTGTQYSVFNWGGSRGQIAKITLLNFSIGVYIFHLCEILLIIYK